MLAESSLAVGRPLPSDTRFSNLWSLIMAIFDDASVNSPRPAFGHEYKKAMPWLHHETQLACEYCGDLVTLEKAKLRDNVRAPDKVWNRLLKDCKK